MCSEPEPYLSKPLLYLPHPSIPDILWRTGQNVPFQPQHVQLLQRVKLWWKICEQVVVQQDHLYGGMVGDGGREGEQEVAPGD